MMKKQLFINNRWEDAASGEVFPVINPANNEVIAELANAGAEDVDRAVTVAKEAFEKGPWGTTMSEEERGRLIRKIGELMYERVPELAKIETMDTGKPITESRIIDIPFSAETMVYFGNISSDIRGSLIPVKGGDFLDYTMYEPIGVTGIIVPWNFPLHLATRSLGAALAAGNTVVLKPSSLAPLTPTIMGEMVLEAGMPPGVINIVTGPGSTTGAALAEHPEVGAIAFTGSTEVGQSIMEAGARNLKKICLELGGKSPVIILPDADLETAVKASLYSFCLNQGEVCCATARVFVHESIHDQFVERIVELAKGIKVGDPMKDDTQMGAIISPEQWKKVDNYVRIGIKEGAKVEFGGRRPEGEKFRKGNFYLPTILSNVTNDMRVAREEIFGPVGAILKFTDVEEAISQANDTPYGLAAGVWTKDLKTGHRVARRLRAGTVWVSATMCGFLRAPYGGYKMSGVGRECGPEGVKEYMELKNVIVDLREKTPNWYEDLYCPAITT